MHIFCIFDNNIPMNDLIVMFLTGAFVYPLTELLLRKRTHISMALAGGLACMLLHGLFSTYPMSFPVKFIVSSALITAIEFIFGFIVNIKLKLGVWDYSKLKYNYKGQICPLFSVLWGFFCIPIIFMSNFVSLF